MKGKCKMGEVISSKFKVNGSKPVRVELRTQNFELP